MLSLLAFLSGLLFIGVLIYLPLGENAGPAGVPAGGTLSPFSPGLREHPGGKGAVPPPAVRSGSNPRIAIVVDDLGYEPARDAAWLQFPGKVTFAVIPFGPSSRKIAKSAHERGFSVLLHVPMEPDGQVNDGTSGFRLRRGMSGAEMEELFSRMLLDVPFAVGASNHMGSAFTADPEAMSLFTAMLKEKGLFLLDSVTTGRSVAVVSALRSGIPAVKRDLFLDVDPDPEVMRRRWSEALSLAKEKGFAVLLCHGRADTLQAIQRFFPDLDVEGIRAVTLAELIAGGG